MISILIPTYNFDVRPFIKSLHQSALSSSVKFEILCYDDNSQNNFQVLNKEIENLDFVKYKLLPLNTGRASIRNLLADDAQYENLLFLDNDGALMSGDFIARYISNLKVDIVVYGGREYEKEKPLNDDEYLHWYYGSNRESMSLSRRKLAPHDSFMTNNFLISKTQFMKIRFNDALKTYGHEDTLFGQALKHRNIEIKHIDNPVIHLGLESKEVFLEKAHQGVNNLLFLYNENLIKKEGIKLLSMYVRIQKNHCRGIVLFGLKLMKSHLMKNLNSQKPKLLYFDLIKLYFSLIAKPNK